MKKYIISYSGAVDIKAKDEEAALQQFFNMTDAELGATIEEYGEIEERKIWKTGYINTARLAAGMNTQYMNIVPARIAGKKYETVLS